MSDALNVLLVDDNPDDRILVLREIHKVLADVVADEVGEQSAMEDLLASNRHWDIAITDYQLRWSTGLELFHRLRARQPELPVIMFTASGSEELAVAALHQGLDDYITKTPRHYGRVPYAIQACVERRRRQRQAEQALAALQRSEALLKLATQSASMDVWEVDLLTRKITVHGGACGLFQGNALELDLDRLIARVHPDDVETVRSRLEAVTAGVARFDTEFRLMRRDGLCWVRAAGIPDRQGRVVGVVENITQRKRTEEQMLLADRHKDQFIATLGHELRNPLAPIRYAAQLIHEGASSASLASARAVIERQANAMALLLDQLLDLSHISTGRIELQRCALDLRQVVQHAVDDARPVAESRRLQFSLALPPTEVPVQADALRVKQVVDNLVHNALKFTPEGGRVRVLLASEPEGSALLAIEDNGLGIPPPMLSQVFEPFVQVHAGPGAPTRGGLGIGLALVQQLVELHHGSVKAISAGTGQGARFEVRLPLTPSPSAKEVPATGSGVSRGRGLDIIVADDQPDAAESLALVLQLEGHDVRIAFDGLQAQAAAVARPPDVMVLDIGMPGATGDQVACWVRNQPWGRQVHLVAVTGWGRPEDQARLNSAGFDVHLVKPVAVERLVAEINRRASMLPSAAPLL
jgi:two-component system CheB/CheR fusion protein